MCDFCIGIDHIMCDDITCDDLTYDDLNPETCVEICGTRIGNRDFE